MLRVIEPEESRKNLARDLDCLKVGDHVNFYCESTGVVPRDALVVGLDDKSLRVIELTEGNRRLLVEGNAPEITMILKTDLSIINNQSRNRETAEARETRFDKLESPRMNG